MALEVHDLIFGEVSALDYGIYIRGSGVYNAPARAVELIDIPGRNGSLTIDKGHYENITIEYPCFTHAEDQVAFRQKLNAFKNAILSQTGYQKLTDTYQPDEYRIALYASGLEVEPTTFNRSGDFTLKFNCKPQRYLSSGQQPIEVNDDDVVVNPTLYESSPLLMVEGYGDIEFNGYTINLVDGSIGTVNLWQKESKRIGSGLTTTISKSFEKAMFENGDTFTFKVDQSIDIYDDFSSMTKTNANASNSWSDNNDGSIRLATEIDNCNFAVGTSSTITNTSVFTFLSTNSVTADMTIAYDGNQTVTYTLTYTVTDMSSLGTVISAYISDCSAVSSLTRLGTPTYIDCEIGEAYKY